MKNLSTTNSTSAAKPTCSIMTKYPEIRRMISAMLDGRFDLTDEKEEDILIEDSAVGITLYSRDHGSHVSLPRPFTKESLDGALDDLLPGEIPTGFTCDIEKRRAILGDTYVTLTPTEFRLFSAIIENGNEFISSEELSKKVWGRSDRNICTVYISYLRKKLDSAFGTGTLITSSGKGYRLRDPHTT